MATEQSDGNPEEIPFGEPLSTVTEVCRWLRVSRPKAVQLPLGWFKVGQTWRCPTSAVAAYANRNVAA